MFEKTDRCLACGQSRPLEELLHDEACDTCRDERVASADEDWRVQEVLDTEAEEAGYL